MKKDILLYAIINLVLLRIKNNVFFNLKTAMSEFNYGESYLSFGRQ